MKSFMATIVPLIDDSIDTLFFLARDQMIKIIYPKTAVPIKKYRIPAKSAKLIVLHDARTHNARINGVWGMDQTSVGTSC